MTPEKSIKILKAVKMLKDDAIGTLIDTTDAYKMAIEALSKQSASGKQANESVIVNFVAFQRKWLKAHKIMELNSADEVMTEIFLKETGKAFINSLSQSVENDGTTDDHIADDSKMVDQFRDTTKKTDDVPDIHVGKIPYKKPEIIRCKDCQYRDPEDKKCDHGHGIVWQLPRPDDWFCADGKA